MIENCFKVSALREYVCERCGVTYRRPPSRAGRFCSTACAAASRKGAGNAGWCGGRVMVVCEQCGKEFTKWPGESKRFCSTACHGKWASKNRVGENNPRWKGGLVERVCEQCGVTYRVEPSKVKRRRFCSRPCYWAHERGENNSFWRGGPVELVCAECGVTFQRTPSEVGQFCSTVCCNKARLRKRVMVVCARCGVSFEVIPSEAESRRFCSAACYSVWMSENLIGENNPSWRGGPVELVCEQCGKVYYRDRRYVAQSRFCSTACYGEWASKNRRGENNSFWRGGISFEPYTAEWTEELREEVREHDGRVCQMCGVEENGQTLHVHHIDYDKANCQPDNLITLCRSCHARTSGGDRGQWTGNFVQLMALQPAERVVTL